MKLRVLSVYALIIVLVLSACLPSMIGNSSEDGSSTGSYQLTYIGSDGNVWVHPGQGGQPKQITTDATGVMDSGVGSVSVTYYFPQISSDGAWIAYRRNLGTPIEAGMEYSDELWVHDLKAGKGEKILDQIPASFTWRPGTHMLAYVPGVPENYFTGNPPDASLATSVMGYDVDTRQTQELMKPERGYAMYALQWSPDGRYLGFDELVYIEGRGPFGYYDFDSGRYVAWEEPIGNYAWHPTEARVFYDHMIYVPTGTEDIFSRQLAAEAEQRLTDYEAENEYAFWPAISPDGGRIAYLESVNGPDSQTYTLQVQDVAGGEPTSLGSFDSVLNLSWSPDGSRLLFSAGPWDAQKVMAVNVTDGTSTFLADGTMPDIADGVKK